MKPLPEILRPLAPLIDREAGEQVLRNQPDPKPDSLVAGTLGTMSFIVTADGDGQVEVSLAGERARPTDGQVRAFFRRWGQPVPADVPIRIIGGRGLFWVVQRGKRHDGTSTTERRAFKNHFKSAGSDPALMARLNAALAEIVGQARIACDRHGLTQQETLALFAYMTGAAIAYQDQVKVTRSTAMEIVMRNIEAGNQAAMAEVLSAGGLQH